MLSIVSGEYIFYVNIKDHHLTDYSQGIQSVGKIINKVVDIRKHGNPHAAAVTFWDFPRISN